MTIADNLTALANQKLSYQDSVEDCKISLANKDVAVPVGAKLADIAGLIDEIQQGIDTSDATATAADLLYGKTAYVNGAKITGEGAMWQYLRSVSFVPNTLFGDVSIWARSLTSMGGFGNQPNMTSIEIDLDYSIITSWRDAFNGDTSLFEIVNEIDFSMSTDFLRIFNSCNNLSVVRIKKSTIKISISFNASPLLTTESLISVANGLNSTTPNVLTMHLTSKTNMNSIMVDNVAGEAVLGSAMTLTQFITNIKTWTIA